MICWLAPKVGFGSLAAPLVNISPMSAFPESGRFYPGETPIFRVRFRPKAVTAAICLAAGDGHACLSPLEEEEVRDCEKEKGTDHNYGCSMESRASRESE